MDTHPTVGVEEEFLLVDQETGEPVANRAGLLWLPLLLVLTANSAVYRNTDAGYASWRSILWGRWPSAGPPPYFDSPDDYDATVRMMLETGAILDEGMLVLGQSICRRETPLYLRATDILTDCNRISVNVCVGKRKIW
jgi:carboxylate-amine ligase